MSETSKKITLLFPGQGSQYSGMSKLLIENFPFAKMIFEEASEAIKENIFRLSQEGPSDTLQLTSNAQPCILTTSFAWAHVLKHELGLRAVAGAGHSLGEYTALLASGALTLTEAVQLVRKRGELMQSAVPIGKGKMAAVIGLDDDRVVELCSTATEGDTSLVVPANFNAPKQVVIAGHTDAVDRAERLAADKQNSRWFARKFIPLKVSSPFHCPLMKKVAEDFFPFLEATSWKPLSFPIAFNVDGRLRKEAELAVLLREQIDHPVLWSSCVKTLHDNAFDFFIEPGPGRVLTGLVKRILEEPKIFSLDSVEELREVEKALKQKEEE